MKRWVTDRRPAVARVRPGPGSSSRGAHLVAGVALEDGDRLVARIDRELGVDGTHLGLDGRAADEELLADLAQCAVWVTNWSRTRHAYPRDVVRGFLNCEGIQKTLEELI